jgi:phosphotransferase system enzyme I (PtsI)
MLSGIAVSKGISIGEAYILDRSKLCALKQTIDSRDIDTEVARFRVAIEKTKKTNAGNKTKGFRSCRKILHNFRHLYSIA